MSSRNQAVAMLLANMREELLTAPSEMIAGEHIEMMKLEEQVLTPTTSSAPNARSASSKRTPRRADGIRVPAPLRRLVLTRRRRVAAFIAALCVLSGNLGLNSAGALPTAVRGITDRITDTIVDTFGVPNATHSRSEGAPTRSESPDATTSRPSQTRAKADPTTPTSAAAPAPASHASSTTPSTIPTTAAPVTPPPTTPNPPTTTVPPSDPGTQPGLPDDWRTQATNAARTELEACANVDGIAPAGCPQVANVDATVAPANVRWKLLNQPLAGATEIAAPPDSDSAGTGAVISVYGQFQMGASYTVGAEASPRFAYSAGVAQATMRWDGTEMQDVTFTSGSVADQLPEGVYVPQFTRPDDATDTAVLAALRLGFDSMAPSAVGPVFGDPLQGAVVIFDPARGNFTVTGIYTITPSDGSDPFSKNYTATLIYVTDAVLLLAIDGV